MHSSAQAVTLKSGLDPSCEGGRGTDTDTVAVGSGR
jgi:hypothetical protein